MGANLSHAPHGSKRLGIQAPSWSWMGLAGEISYDKYKPLGYDTVISHFVDAEVLSPADIRLRLRAPLLKATSLATAANTLMVWDPPASGVRFIIYESSGLTGYGVIDSENEVKWQVNQDGVCTGNATDSHSFSVSFDVLAEEAAVHEFYLMGIHRRIRDKDDYVEGLALQENADASFSRVGWFSTKMDSFFPCCNNRFDTRVNEKNKTHREQVAWLFLEAEQRDIVLV
ncbi:hypothetical protein PG984_007664 [Apiospora sp. TS-2023a]